MTIRKKHAAAIRLGIEYRRAQAGWPPNESIESNMRRCFTLGLAYWRSQAISNLIARLARDGYHHWSAIPKGVRK